MMGCGFAISNTVWSGPRIQGQYWNSDCSDIKAKVAHASSWTWFASSIELDLVWVVRTIRHLARMLQPSFRWF